MRSLRHKVRLFLGQGQGKIKKSMNFGKTLKEIRIKKKKDLIDKLLDKEEVDIKNRVKSMVLVQQDKEINMILQGKLDLIDKLRKELEKEENGNS